MKFELLPNELLIVCLEYLSIFDIFLSFDQLNYRFSKLIRKIPFQLNFENGRKLTFDQFCTKLVLNPEIKRQIYSLKLSNKDTCGQIEEFLSRFSLNEFSHLRSLKLSDIEDANIPKLKSMLPLLSKLSSVHMIEDHEILNTLPISNLRTLTMLSLHSIQTRIHETLNITNLTIHSCSLEHLLYHLFKYFPLLKYLNVRFVSRYNYPIKNDTTINTSNGIHLKQLIIGLFKYNFEDFEMFVKQIPNLKSLTIYTKDSISMINAYKWENLIQSSLIYLNNFKFKFGCERRYNDKFIFNIFKQFQNDFWCKQHQWYTEYSLEKHFAFIYTIPYISTTHKLDINTTRFPLNNSNIFNKVTHVTLHHEVITDKCQYYFSNIHSLELLITEQNQCPIPKPIDMYYLKMIVNLSNLKHLNISEYGRMLTSGLLLDILKESVNVSWITMNPNDLILLFHDDELCKYFNKMIKKLDILKYAHPSFNNSDEMNKFCEIFSNIEQLTCYVIQPNDVLVLVNQLVKLSTVNVYLPKIDDREYFLNLFEEESRRLNSIFRVEGIDRKSPKLNMWIGRNMK